MFITTCLKFYFPYCSFYISKTTLIKTPHLYCPFHLVCHWDFTQMTLRKSIVTMHKIQQEPVIMRLILFISLITVPLLFCCQCGDYFLFMCSAFLLRWFWATERIVCECIKLDGKVCSLWLFIISHCQYNVPHFIKKFVLEQIPGIFCFHCALWWSLLFIDSALTFEPYFSNMLNLPFISLKMWIACIFTLQAVTALEEVICVNCSIYPQETLLSVEQTQLYNV